MNNKEFITKLKKIEFKYFTDMRTLKEAFAMSNNPYKIGDIIKSYHEIIKISTIGLHPISHSFIEDTNIYKPQCIYEGVMLRKKDLMPFKSGEERTIVQSGVREKYNDTS